jgi:predicted phage tail protein
MWYIMAIKKSPTSVSQTTDPQTTTFQTPDFKQQEKKLKEHQNNLKKYRNDVKKIITDINTTVNNTFQQVCAHHLVLIANRLQNRHPDISSKLGVIATQVRTAQWVDNG